MKYERSCIRGPQDIRVKENYFFRYFLRQGEVVVGHFDYSGVTKNDGLLFDSSLGLLVGSSEPCQVKTLLTNFSDWPVWVI